MPFVFAELAHEGDPGHAGFLLDLALGDPPNRWHPVAAIGHAQHPVIMAIAQVLADHVQLFRAAGLLGGKPHPVIHGRRLRQRDAAVDQRRQYKAMREIVDSLPFPGCRAGCGFDRDDNTILHHQTHIFTHSCAAAVNQAACHNVSSIDHRHLSLENRCYETLWM